jgi:hypothetical protein
VCRDKDLDRVSIPGKPSRFVCQKCGSKWRVQSEVNAETRAETVRVFRNEIEQLPAAVYPWPNRMRTRTKFVPDPEPLN